MRLSVIIPVYNAEPWLAKAIDSALIAAGRIGNSWELILVDNNSTDGSRSIMEDYRRRLPNRITLLSEAKQGAPAARNRALREAKGDWVQFLDADDLLLPHKIHHQFAAVTPETEWVIAAYRNTFANGSTSVVVPAQDPWRGLVDGLRVGNTNANLYRRATLSRIGNWNEATPAFDDPNLHFRLLRSEAIFTIDVEVGSIYRHHSGPRVTSGDKGEQVRQAVALHQQVNRYLASSRPQYWQEQFRFFRGALLRKIRILATYDLAAAAEAYRSFGVARATEEDLSAPYPLVPMYTRLYPHLGFQRLESIRLALAGVLPPSLKNILKS